MRNHVPVSRTAILVLSLAMLAACSAAQTPAIPSPGQPAAAGASQPAAGGNATQAAGGDAPSLAVAALAVKDVCPLMPMDLAARLVPSGAAPQSQRFPPLRCTISNQVSVLEVTIDGGFGAVEPIPGAEVIPDLGQAAYLEVSFVDDAYLTVVLGTDPDAALHIEVAGHDKKDHKEDAIAVARAVIAKLR